MQDTLEIESEVKNSDLTVVAKKTEISLIAEKIDNGLIAFEKRKQELITLKSEAHGLKITSLEDKENIKTVSFMRKKLKSARVEIEKEGKSMRDPLTHISKNISAKEKELVEIIEPTEKELMVQEKWVEGEEEKIRAAAELAEKQRIQGRIDKLAAYGYAIDYDVVISIPDETFEKVLNNARVEHEKELAAKAEEKRLADLEAQRIVEERKELEKLRAQQIENQRIIDEQNEKIRKDQQEKEATILAEQKRIEDEKRTIELQKQKEIEDKLRAEQLEKSKAEAAQKAIRDKEAADHQAKIDAEEKLAMASDKVKFQTIINYLGYIKFPEMKSKKSKALAAEVVEMLAKVTNHILTGIK